MTARFATLTEVEERELHRLSTYYWREARRCETAKAYLAGCAVLGSALEALLMLMVNVYADEADATGAVPLRDGKPLPLLRWDLSQLLQVAKKAAWLPSGLQLGGDWKSRKAKVGDYAEASRMIRNLIHPGRYVREHSPSRITARYLQGQFEIVLACQGWLAKHNNESLRRHMEADGLL